MQVQKITPSYNTSFKRWDREVFENVSDSVIRLKHRNHTTLYRDTRLWVDLCNFLVSKYNDCKKVNVYNLACSNGSEPFTFVMHMFSNFDKKIAEKFMPVYASDYDEVAIKEATKGTLPLGFIEIHTANKYTGGQLDEFIDIDKNYFAEDFQTKFSKFYFMSESENGSLYKLNDHYAKKIKYKVANVLDEYKNIEPENSVVIARNFWPYLTAAERKTLVKGLAKRLQKNCTLVTGVYDESIQSPSLFQQLHDKGFKLQSSMHNIYTKD